MRIAAAVAAFVFALALYTSTLLPGQDLGDTASFQAAAGDSVLTPRDGYPLYFAVTGAFVRTLPLERAHAANLASAVLAASIFHFGEFTVGEAKQYMAAAGIPMRLT